MSSAFVADATIDVAEFIDRHGVGRFQIRILPLCFLVSVGASGAGLLTAGLAGRFGWSAIFYVGAAVALAAVNGLDAGVDPTSELKSVHFSRLCP